MSLSGVVLAVCAGPGGIPKHTLASTAVGTDGIPSDGHNIEVHGGERRALCLMSLEEREDLEAEGVPKLEPGGYGENLLVRGLDFRLLRPGMRLVCGASVTIELLDIRSPCRTLKSIDPRFPDLMVGRSGFLARVIQSGHLEPGMRLAVVE